MSAVRLGLNVDHIATVRQARGGNEPDPVTAAAIGELAGAHGIVVHLRGDRRHIQDRDLELLRRTIKSWLNVEMAATEEMIAIAERIKPDQVTLVPERPGEITTEGGLDVVGNFKSVKETVKHLIDAGILASIFIDPDRSQIEASREADAQMVELNTDAYSKTKLGQPQEKAFDALRSSTEFSASLGLKVAAGHGLNYLNARRIALVPEIEELNIGHSIIARATLTGLEKAVQDMIHLISTTE